MMLLIYFIAHTVLHRRLTAVIIVQSTVIVRQCKSGLASVVFIRLVRSRATSTALQLTFELNHINHLLPFASPYARISLNSMYDI